MCVCVCVCVCRCVFRRPAAAHLCGRFGGLLGPTPPFTADLLAVAFNLHLQNPPHSVPFRSVRYPHPRSGRPLWLFTLVNIVPLVFLDPQICLQMVRCGEHNLGITLDQKARLLFEREYSRIYVCCHGDQTDIVSILDRHD